MSRPTFEPLDIAVLSVAAVAGLALLLTPRTAKQAKPSSPDLPQEPKWKPPVSAPPLETAPKASPTAPGASPPPKTPPVSAPPSPVPAPPAKPVVPPTSSPVAPHLPKGGLLQSSLNPAISESLLVRQAADLIFAAQKYPLDVDLAEMDRFVVVLKKAGRPNLAGEVRLASNEAFLKRPQKFKVDVAVCEPGKGSQVLPETVRARIAALLADPDPMPTSLEYLADVLDGCGGFQVDVERLRTRALTVRGIVSTEGGA